MSIRQTINQCQPVILCTDEIRAISFRQPVQMNTLVRVTNGIASVEVMRDLIADITVEQFEWLLLWHSLTICANMKCDDLTINFGDWSITSGCISYNGIRIRPWCDFSITRNERGDILLVLHINGIRKVCWLPYIKDIVALSMAVDDSILY
jgi:hypothetical protein